MSDKAKIRRPSVSSIIKILICLICLASVSFGLVTYTNGMTSSPPQQLSVDVSTATWTVYVNEVNQVRYMPGGFSEPTLNTGDASTYAFKVATNENNVCAVKVELTSAVDASKFSQFDITVLSSTAGGTWNSEPLYTAPTGTTTTVSINGLIPGDVAYIHQGASTTKYYLIQVTYSYNQVADNTPMPLTFAFTQIPTAGFV